MSKIDFRKRFDIPLIEKLDKTFHSFSFLERITFLFLCFFLIVSTISMLWKINDYISTEIPVEGGKIVEGVIGFPRFINPVLAISDADRDLSILVYSGLMKATPDGRIIKDLAESYEISGDGLTYTFKIKDSATFHDGEPVTADDILFTIQKSQDSVIKSPKRAAWDGVQTEKIGEKEVRFTLKQPYSPFLENTTLGILPKHIWGKIDSEQFIFSRFNIEPIGSGPYKIKSIESDSAGVSEYYTLEPFADYSLNKPFISEIETKFYSNEEELNKAYGKGSITSMNTISSLIAEELRRDGERVERYPLPRVFAVFLNQNQAQIFTHKEIRQALDMATDKEYVVKEVLNNYGEVAETPIPPGSIKLKTTESVRSKSFTDAKSRANAAIDILEKNGWKLNKDTNIRTKKFGKKIENLEFTLTTSNIPELKKTAQLIQGMWAKIGVKVNLQFFETTNLNQDIIRPRKYDALLFGEIVGRDMDLFAFWHSSQRNDPGLNIASYTNIKTDKILEEIRKMSDEKEKYKKYVEFIGEVKKDTPAIFLYSPDFVYTVPKNLKGFELGVVTTPAERFLDVNNWYINTQKVWNIFVE
ncbi:MAG: Extracellular solute-binding protein family 5 [Parcubacteria group bacterium Athens0714_16]|nr:MAG: Extracellular solute-binding protein family 5 [Parcubacteria group bacterium Athens0714_16]